MKEYPPRQAEKTYCITPNEFLEKFGLKGELTTLFKRRGKGDKHCIEFKVMDELPRSK